MKRHLRFVSLFLFTASVAVAALAQNDGNTIVKKVEATLNAPKDRVAVMSMKLIDKNGNVKNRVVKIYQKGDDKRLIRFLKPADVKGVGLLVLTDDEMWLYMPAFHKIRRIASHTKNENFMGTDFTYDDMAQTKYSEKYSARILQQSPDSIKLELIPKPGADVNYSKLVMVVDPHNWIPMRVEFYDKSGSLKKVLTNSRVAKVDGYWTVQEMTMRDVQAKHKTVLTLSDVKHDTGLANSVFTKRFLRRSE